MLSAEENIELAILMEKEHYSAGQLIVQEGDLIEKVYIIVSGQAEVNQKIEKTNTLELLAVISAGDAIGLNDTGFFSLTGKRTASVIALSEMTLLSLSLKQLHSFLQKYSYSQSKMLASTEHMLKILLIKNSLPFANISHERVEWLANHVEKMSVAAGEYIFRQGEKGSKCYLIESGKIAIVATAAKGTKNPLAVLRTPSLFGEAVMMTREARSASAKAQEDCVLLALDYTYLTELIESESEVAKTFMTLMIERSQPLQDPHVTDHHRQSAEGQAIVILKNPMTQHYFKLSSQGWFIWQQLDGKKTMQTITLAFAEKFHVFAPEVIVTLISRLAHAGFVQQVAIHQDDYVSQNRWVKCFTRLKNILDVSYAFGNVDKKLEKIYNKGIYLLFTRRGEILLALYALAGFIAFLCLTNDTIDSFVLMPNIWYLLIPFVPFTLISVALHELGHAFATKSFGHEVHYMGDGWSWFRPLAFTDTSDMWLSTRGPRIVVNLAGVYIDSIVAGSCALTMLLISNPYIQAFLWLFALFTYINAFRMMNPLQDLDGYYALMDYVDKPKLRESSLRWLIHDFSKALRQPKLFHQNKAELGYWVSCLIFIVMTSCITWFVQTFIMKSLGLQTSSLLLTLSLPVLMGLLSSLVIVRDIKKSENEKSS